MIQSYKELVKHVPLLKDLSDQGDVESLEVLYKNVSLYLATFFALLIPYFLVMKGN
jgi:hypothetical protein